MPPAAIAYWCECWAQWCRACGLGAEATEWTRLADYWRAQHERMTQ